MTMEPEPPTRQWRGRPWREASFASLDFETTGLDLHADEVVSFGVVPVMGGRIMMRRAVYQETRAARASGSSAVGVHTLRPRDLAVAPSLAASLGTLRSALDRRYILAWSAQIEISFLSRAFGGSSRMWRRRTIDVQRLAVALDRSNGLLTSSYALEAVADRMGVPVDEPHHALDDALTTAQVFLMLAARLEERGAITTRRLSRAARRGRVATARSPAHARRDAARARRVSPGSSKEL
jgi:DNA polymerase-3 subunit epsilon